MKKAKDELRSEYRPEDLKGGIRGKYSKQYQTGTNLVLLRPEVAALFPTDEAVNDALLSLVKVANHTISPTTGRSIRARTKARAD
jgi:hypothetical protein